MTRQTSRTPGTVSAKGTSRTACRRNRSRRTRAHSRVGRYRQAFEILDKGSAENDDAEIGSNALLTSAWLLIEQKQYARALEKVRAAEKLLADRPRHSLLVLADLIGGVAEIRAGNVASASTRLIARKTRYDNIPTESNWVAAFDGEVALAQGRYDAAVSSFKAGQKKAWMILGRDDTTVFATSMPTRDGLARVEMARGNRKAAIAEYRRLTTVSTSPDSSAVLEPRYILELARLLDSEGDTTGA